MPLKRGIEDGTDDTEGNAVKGHPAPAIESDDAEGHLVRGHGGVTDAADDTEGNGRKWPGTADVEDTEGNAGHARFVDDGTDDTEGNGRQRP